MLEDGFQSIVGWLAPRSRLIVKGWGSGDDSQSSTRSILKISLAKLGRILYDLISRGW